MIFTFSATGNSRYAAEKIAIATGDSVISIGQALRDEQFDFDVTGEERIGFVMPTFAWTLPGAVALFIRRMHLTGYSGQYLYGVFTCGASSGGESAALRTLLGEKSIGYNGSFDLVMPDNFIIWSDVPSPTRLNAILEKADRKLEQIIDLVRAKRNGAIDTGMPKDISMPMSDISTSQNTSKFYATDACTACALCMELCPMRCIKPNEQGHPLWEGSCTMCLACLHRCPAEAIQYGRDTLGKKRYVNPKAGHAIGRT